MELSGGARIIFLPGVLTPGEGFLFLFIYLFIFFFFFLGLSVTQITHDSAYV